VIVHESVPENVLRLAVALTLYEANIEEIMRGSAESNALFAAEAGLTASEYLAAATWLCRFHEKFRPAMHADGMTEIPHFGTSH
jgi:hypothetical protein